MSETLFRDDAYATRCTAVVIGHDERGVRLNRTVFYPTGGGQPGDSGMLRWAAGSRMLVVDTIKGGMPDDVVHVPGVEADLPPVGTEVEAAIDWQRRHRHMRMHTALHLLCAVVPGAVTGGQIGAERSRLDFDVASGSLDKDGITSELNRLVSADYPVLPRWITDDELAARPELVRTMSVKPPTGMGRVRLLAIGPVDAPIDLQPCGGTHVARTGEIGAVEIVKIENKGRQNRRVVIALSA
jgi:misacylated tRNA(Ala) deacylase